MDKIEELYQNLESILKQHESSSDLVPSENLKFRVAILQIRALIVIADELQSIAYHFESLHKH